MMVNSRLKYTIYKIILDTVSDLTRKYKIILETVSDLTRIKNTLVDQCTSISITQYCHNNQHKN